MGKELRIYGVGGVADTHITFRRNIVLHVVLDVQVRLDDILGRIKNSIRLE